MEKTGVGEPTVEKRAFKPMGRVRVHFNGEFGILAGKAVRQGEVHTVWFRRRRYDGEAPDARIRSGDGDVCPGGTGGQLMRKQSMVERDRLEKLEAELAELKREVCTGLFDGVRMALPGGIRCTLPTEDLEIVDAGTAGATEVGWIEGKLGDGTTVYLRGYASKRREEQKAP